MEKLAASDTALVDEYVTSDQIGIPVKTLRNMRWAGGGPPYFKLGASVRYLIPEVREWIEAHRVRNTTEGEALRIADATAPRVTPRKISTIKKARARKRGPQKRRRA